MHDLSLEALVFKFLGIVFTMIISILSTWHQNSSIYVRVGPIIFEVLIFCVYLPQFQRKLFSRIASVESRNTTLLGFTVQLILVGSEVYHSFLLGNNSVPDHVYSLGIILCQIYICKTTLLRGDVCIFSNQDTRDLRNN